MYEDTITKLQKVLLRVMPEKEAHMLAGLFTFAQAWGQGDALAGSYLLKLNAEGKFTEALIARLKEVNLSLPEKLEHLVLTTHDAYLALTIITDDLDFGNSYVNRAVKEFMRTGFVPKPKPKKTE
jgi:hypothetical protein